MDGFAEKKKVRIFSVIYIGSNFRLFTICVKNIGNIMRTNQHMRILIVAIIMCVCVFRFICAAWRDMGIKLLQKDLIEILVVVYACRISNFFIPCGGEYSG